MIALMLASVALVAIGAVQVWMAYSVRSALFEVKQ